MFKIQNHKEETDFLFYNHLVVWVKPNLREFINDATLLRNLQLEELHFLFFMGMTQVCQGARPL